MSNTEIINKTSKVLKLKVGNNLVFTDLTDVAVEGSYTVRVDPNATYQEYYMGMDRNGKVLIINSDECADSRSITIEEDSNGTYSAKKESRSMQPAPDKTRSLNPRAPKKTASSSTWKFWNRS